ncbi:hypothetical protein NHF50_12530 [Flavobacterium sp. NRK F10]|uniref:hypothetical protein n=1 Tax=Flavobacterium sp. NRK F10 TaxID=2954931 RepID=UPI00209066F9|nr:hypothetical protein [Flavobacterium sp. NRK F10]MCO6175870.1 hypothetical protein [Flavobacterium sp. NRK F10]
MKNNLSISNDDVSLCYKNSCIHAKGSNAKLLAIGAFAMFVLIGISAISKSN